MLINIVLFFLSTTLFFIRCENEIVNLDSNQIDTSLEPVKFSIDSDNSYSFVLDVDSLNISNSHRLYASSQIGNELSAQSPISNILLSANLSEINEESACSSDSISTISFELSSLNQLIKKETDEDGEEVISDIYIDTNQVQIWAGNLNLDWDSSDVINYNDFISQYNYQDIMTSIDFKIDEYDIVIDSLNKYFSDFCELEKLDFIITYDALLVDDDVKDYLELFSSDYVFEPSQPKLTLNYNILEEETIIHNKFDINSIESEHEFNSYIVNDSISDDWGKVLLVNYDNGSSSNLTDKIHVDSIDITNPLISDIPSDISLTLRFLVSDNDVDLYNIGDDRFNDFFPIQLYLNNLVGYKESNDPGLDNWNDCGADGMCSNDFPDEDGSEGNGIWDLGEGYEKNNQLDWIDANSNNLYEYDEALIELYDDFGFDGCADEYEDGNGGCLELENPNYNPSGTESNNIYNNKESFNDYGEDGCADEYEDGNGGCLESENPDYDSELNADPNGDNYNFLSNYSGTELNGAWNNNEGTENNNQYDSGELFFDVGSDGLPDELEENPDYDNYNLSSNPNGTENNGVWDIGEPYYDHGEDGIINYLEDNYNLDGKENNGVYNSGESIIEDYGEDGCFDEYEDGDGGCLESENPDYDSELNPDPNGDNYLEDINNDNWNDCGTDGICSDDSADEDGTEGNGMWDIGERYENNNQFDWIDTNLNSVIEMEDEQYELWYDDGADNTPDSLEFLNSNNYLSTNIIHDLSSYINCNNQENLSIDDIEVLIDESKDINVWFSDINYDNEGNFYDVNINLRVNSPTKAIEFSFSHLPNIYLDSLYNENTEIFYGGFNENLIKDITIYDFEVVESFEQELNSDIFLNYAHGIEVKLDFEGLNNFLNQDSTISISSEYSNLFMYLDYENSYYNFDEGFSDIYYKGIDSDIFLKRIYFDDPDSVVIPIGDLIQRFIDKTIVYNGINLKLSSGGYNFNNPGFYLWETNQDSVFNPRIEIIYSK